MGVFVMCLIFNVCNVCSPWVICHYSVVSLSLFRVRVNDVFQFYMDDAFWVRMADVFVAYDWWFFVSLMMCVCVCNMSG